MPDHRDLHLLIAGVVAGLLLGPAVLGRLAPDAYDHLFVDPAAGSEEVRETLQADIDRRLAKLEASGATDVALDEIGENLKITLAAAESERLAAIHERLDARIAWLLGLMAVAGAVMVAETLIDPHAPGTPARLRDRLVTSRYALLAAGVAVMLAQPALLRRLPIAFIVLAFVVVAAATLIPWPRAKEDQPGN